MEEKDKLRKIDQWLLKERKLENKLNIDWILSNSPGVLVDIEEFRNIDIDNRYDIKTRTKKLVQLSNQSFYILRDLGFIRASVYNHNFGKDVHGKIILSDKSDKFENHIVIINHKRDYEWPKREQKLIFLGEELSQDHDEYATLLHKSVLLERKILIDRIQKEKDNKLERMIQEIKNRNPPPPPLEFRGIGIINEDTTKELDEDKKRTRRKGIKDYYSGHMLD